MLLLTLVVLMVSGVGGVHGESQETQHPEKALMICPLTEDVSQTKHIVVIKHLPYKGGSVTVFGCDWLRYDPDKPDCRSHHNFTLLTLGKDYVVVSVPRTQLKEDGSYQCQLMPPDDVQPFTTCRVFHSDDAEDPPTAISAVTPSTAADQPQPRDRTGEEPSGANGDHLWQHVVLAFTALMFLLNMIGMAMLYVRLGRHRRRKLLNSFGQEERHILGEAPGVTNAGEGQETRHWC